jgi:uncharacterized membrane protein YeaQ/YmgE (transglycosylase-associated protein family)
MTIVTWLIAGGLTGWTASYYLGQTAPQGIAFNIAVAVLGAAFVGWIVAPLLGVAAGFSAFALFVSALGAAALLAGVHFVQHTVTH